MAANNKQKLKLLCLYKMLSEQTDETHGLSMADILEGLAEQGIDAERKGIYRDMKVLREFGCEITTIQRMPVEYTMAKQGLELGELNLLVDVVQSSRFLTTQTSNRLVKKLSAMASTHEREQMKSRVHVDGRIKSQTDSVFFNVDIIHQAIRERKKVSFLYYKYYGKFERKIQHNGEPYVLTPVQVVFSEGFYYAVMYSDNHEKFLVFRIDRMRIVQLAKEPVTRNERIANYGLEEFAYQAFGMFNGKPVCAKLHVEPASMDIVADRFGTEVPTKQRRDGLVEVDVTVRTSPQFFGWVAGMNGQVNIAGPKGLVNDYRAWLKEMVKLSN